MGGKAAMQFALQFPKRVEKLVVVDMAPRAYAPAHDAIFTALLALDLQKFENRVQIETALAPEIADLALRRFLLKNLGRNSAGGFSWKINLAGVAKNYPHLCAPVFHPRPFDRPVLLVRGGKSDYLHPNDEPGIHALFPQVNLQTIAGAGHWVHADQPEEFLSMVLKFLRPV
jgi:pimeloyl-ACP methyl ester carboxylesterase